MRAEDTGPERPSWLMCICEAAASVTLRETEPGLLEAAYSADGKRWCIVDVDTVTGKLIYARAAGLLFWIGISW